MKSLFGILFLILITSCAPIYVNYDYETGTNFNQYKTYNIFPDMESGLSELDEKRLLNAIDQMMQERGLTVSEVPDFYVNITSKEYQADRRNTVGVGVGGGGRNVGGGVSIGIPVGQANVNRELIFDLIDVKKDDLFWQAVSEESYNPKSSPEKRQEKLKAIVAKVFSEYPPEKSN